MPWVGVEHREGEAEAQGIRRKPRWTNHPGADSDLGTGRGRKRGDKRTQETAAYAGMLRGDQSRAAEAGGWWVWTISIWTAFRASRGGGGWAKQREVIR